MPSEANGAERFSYGAATSQFAELHLPAGPGPHPVIALIHGGYWKNDTSLHTYPTAGLIAPLVASGRAVWNIEYRRLGEEGGGYPGTLRDAGLALDALRDIPQRARLDLGSVTLVGHSAGGHLALWLASSGNLSAVHELHRADPLTPKAIVCIAGVLDLARAWYGGLANPAEVPRLMPGPPAEQPEAFAAASPIQLIPPVGQVTLVHGQLDRDVEPIQSRLYAQALRAAGGSCELVELPEGDHFSMLQPGSAEWRRLQTILLRPVAARN